MHDRLIRTDAHDDGVNAWRMTHVAPCGALAGLIQGFSDYEERTTDFTVRRELPHGDAVLIVNLGDAISITGGDGKVVTIGPGAGFVAGAHLRPALSASNGTQRGLHVFLSLPALRRLVGVPMHELTDRVVPLDALLGQDARILGDALSDARTIERRIALIEAAVSAQAARTATLRAEDVKAFDLVARRPDRDLREIARDIGWSRKHLATRVRDLAGVGPRSYRRIVRFSRAVRATGQGSLDLAQVAYASGYCDQAHFYREFREFAGITPSVYRARFLTSGGGLVEP